MSSGPIFAAVLEKDNAVEDFRTLIGATNPAEAAEKLGIKIYDGQVEQTEQQKAAQAFKNTMTEITKGLDLSKYNDLGYNPFKIEPGQLLDQSVDFNIPGLAGTLGNYGTADYSELLKKYPNIFSNK